MRSYLSLVVIAVCLRTVVNLVLVEAVDLSTYNPHKFGSMTDTPFTFTPDVWLPTGPLSTARVLSSVVFSNDSFVVVGGCLNQNCSERSTSVSLYDPRKGYESREYDSLGVGVAGLRSTVVLANGIFVVHMCSMLLPGETWDDTLYRTIARISPTTGEVNNTFIVLPSEAGRANASCVAFGNSVYIIGGLQRMKDGTLKMTDKIARYDFAKEEYEDVWAAYKFAVMNPAVAQDNTGFYVSGGLTVSNTLSRLVYAYYPEAHCSRELQPSIPNEFDGSDFTMTVFAEYMVITAPHRDFFASRRFISRTADTTTWSFYNMSSHTANATSAQLAALRGRDSSWMPIPMCHKQRRGNVTIATTRLVLYQFGGVQNSWDNTTNETRTFVSNAVSLSVTNIEIPSAVGLTEIYVQERYFLNLDHHLDMPQNCSDAGSDCRVALAVRPDCEVISAGATVWQRWHGSPVVFLAYAATNPVYVCFSFGPTNARCDTAPGKPRQAVPRTYYPTNVFSPTAIVNRGDTNAPTDHGRSSNKSILLYILGGVALFTTLVAVLLVARLRRVPDEGIMTQAPQFAHQEERYKTIAKIGEGAFSAVYLVIRRKDGRRFAMKHMECQSDAARQDAIKECEIMRTLQGHPNVINLVDMFMNYEFDNHLTPDSAPQSEAATSSTHLLQNGSAAGLRMPTQKRSRHLCLVMEYHSSGDLKRWLGQYAGHPSEAVLCSIAFQVVSVLVHIHNQEPPVIHRDLKPENILINNNAPPSLTFLPIVVTDFGLARLQEDSHCKQGAGTLPYVAPECFRKFYTTQCDMWSLGCVLYALATKRVSHETVRLMFEDCRHPNFQTAIRNDLASLGYQNEFTEFVLQLLRVDPTDRLTATKAFKLFRKKGELIYLSSRIAPTPSKPIKAKRVTKLAPAESSEAGSVPGPEALARIAAEPVPLRPPNRDGSPVEHISVQEAVLAEIAEEGESSPSKEGTPTGTPKNGGDAEAAEPSSRTEPSIEASAPGQSNRERSPTAASGETPLNEADAEQWSEPSTERGDASP